MAFKSWKDYEFYEHNVKYTNRFVHSIEVAEFLANIKATLPAREKILSARKILFRSQIGFDEYEDEGQIIISGSSRTRMKPIPLKGWEGRANPKGISYLYLSNDENTSMAELRPHIGEYISSAQFEVNRTLRLVDCFYVSKYIVMSRVYSIPHRRKKISNTRFGQESMTHSPNLLRTTNQILIMFQLKYWLSCLSLKDSMVSVLRAV